MCCRSCPRPPKISVTALVSAVVSDMMRLPACAPGSGGFKAKHPGRAACMGKGRQKCEWGRAQAGAEDGRRRLQRERLEEVVDGDIGEGSEGELLDKHAVLF